MVTVVKQSPKRIETQDAGRTRAGAFVVSLDFELAWGTRGRKTARHVGPDLDGTRQAIHGLLKIFERYEIPATWVVVGGMFLGGATRHEWLSAAEFDDIPVGDCRSQPHWYAEDILEQLLACKTRQEIGCHTLTHMFVHDSQSCRERFDLELSRCVLLHQQLGLERPRSFIFPKHFMAHFDLLVKHGFEVMRGPEAGWFEHLPTVRGKALGRLLSAKLRQAPSVTQAGQRQGLMVVPSSQFYAPFRSVGKYVSIADRVAKARKGLDAAARSRSVFHLWTHPFNLGSRTSELLHGFEQICAYAAELRAAGSLQTLSMDAFLSAAPESLARSS